MEFKRSKISRVAVPAISFAQIPALVNELRSRYPDSKINTECKLYHQNPADTIEYLKGFDAAIVSFEPISESVLSQLPELKVVSKLGTGLDQIDPRAMRRHGVRLGWAPGVNKRSVAELALCLTLAALRNVMSANLQMRSGLKPIQSVGRLLTGRTVGIHGCGEIGREFIKLLLPFSCRLLGCDIADRSEFFDKHNVESVSAMELYEQSEIISIHVNANELNHHLYNQKVLEKLRPDCVLINTSRGSVIDQSALKQHLVAQKIAAAASDVFEREPPDDMELLNLPNFIATPHLGASAMESRMKMGRQAIEGLTKNFLPQPGEYPFDDVPFQPSGN